MQSKKVLVTFGPQNIYLSLPDDPEEFKKEIDKQFQITQFIAEVQDNKMQQIKFEFYNSQSIKKEDMLKLKQLGCKSIKIVEVKDNIKNLQFFEAFINGNEIQCCTRSDCVLCKGNGAAIINENDHQFINKVIRDKLNKRLKDISEIIKGRDNTKISTPEDFLKYHQIVKSEFLSITPQSVSYQFFQEKNVTKQEDIYKVKIMEEPQITGEQGSQVILQLKYMNVGFLNWPEIVYLVCNEGPFNIRQNVKSAIKQNIISQEIKIHIPDIPPKKYEFSCKFEYYNEQNQKVQFGPPIIINLLVKEKNRQNMQARQQYSYEKNRQLIPKIQNQLLQMGYNLNEVESKMNTVFQRFAHQQLTLESFMDEFYKIHL